MRHFIALIIFLFTLLIPGFSLDSIDKDYDKWVKEGRRQYEKLLAFNAKNTLEGHPEDNWYVFSFIPGLDWQEICKDQQASNSGAWVNDPQGVMVTPNFVDDLNANVAAFNANNPKNVQLYVNLSNGWRLHVPSSITVDVGTQSTTSDIITYLKTEGEKSEDWKASLDEYKDEIVGRFQTLCSDIINATNNTPFTIPANGNRVVYNYAQYQMYLPDGSSTNPNSNDKVLGSRQLVNFYFAKGSYFESCENSFDYYVNAADRSVAGTTPIEKKVEHYFYSVKDYVEGNLCGSPGSCDYLLTRYADHPYLTSGSHALKTAIQNNPCLLATFEHHEFIDTLGTSKWMEDLKNICAYMLGSALSVPAIEAAIPVVIEQLTARNAMRCATGIGIDAMFQAGFEYYFPKDSLTVVTWPDAYKKINWTQTGFSCLENLVDTDNTAFNVLASSTLGCISGGLQYGTPEDPQRWVGIPKPEAFNGKECAKGALVGAIAQGVFATGGWAFGKLKNMPIDRFFNGLGRLGISENQFAGIFKKFRNIDNADDLGGFLMISPSKAQDLINNAAIRDQLLNGGELVAKLRRAGLNLAEREQFIDDFLDQANGPGFRDALMGDAGLVNMWAVFATRTDVALKALRTNLSDLNILSNYLAIYPNNVNLIKSGLEGAVNKRGYLDWVKHVGTDLEDYHLVFRNWEYGSNNLSWSQYFDNLKISPNFPSFPYEQTIADLLNTAPYNTVSNNQAYAIFSYTTIFYQKKFDKWLREGLNQDITAPISGLLISALNKMPTVPSGVNYFRGINLSGADLSDFLSKHKQNAEVTYADFTSAANNIADSFYSQGNIKIKIITKENSVGRTIHDFSFGKFQLNTSDEAVFKSGFKFKVENINPLGGDIYEFVLREID